MTTPNPKFPAGLPPSRGPASSNRTPGHTSSSRSNVVPPGVPGKRGVPQSNKFSAPADSSGVETREKEYSDEEHHTESDRGYEDEPQFRPEHGEEPEIKSRKPRFGYKHTGEEDNQDEGIENEEDTPKNLMSLSESLMAMKNLRSNFQSFQFEAEAEEHDDEHIDRANDEYEDEDYVKVESGEEENIQRTEEDMEPEEEHYEEEDYYERARASGSLKGVKDHYIEKIHEEPYEESHKDAEEEIDRPLITEEDKEEGGYIQSIPEDVVPVSSNQNLQEPLIKHDKPEEEEDEKIEREEPPKEEHKHHELQSPSKKEDEEIRRSLQKSQDLGAAKDKVQEERDRFFEELEGGPSHLGVTHKQTEEEQPPKSPARDEPLRKSDNYEPPQVAIGKEESPLKIKHEEPQKEEEPQQKEESEDKPDVPPPIFGLPAPRRNMPPQRGHGPPHRGGVPPRGGIPGQRVNIPPTRVNVPPQREVESPQVEEKPLQIAEVPQREEPVKAEPEVQHKEIISSPTKHEVPEKEEKPVQQIVEPPQREKEVQEAPEKEELPPIGGGAQIQRRNVPPQREAPVQAPKFFVPSSQPENVNKQPVRFPQQQAFVPSGPSAQRTQSDAEYEAMVVANAKDSSDNTLLVRLKNVEIELKKEKKKNELLESERERLVVESKDLKQQVLDLKSQLEHSNKSHGSESVSHREQETLEKLRQELKTTVEGSRLVTEHSNKIIGESAKYKQEMEALVNSLEEEKRQLQKSVLELKAQVHEEQLKVETQHQKTEFFERKAKEFEESFDMVHRQLNERIETLQKLTSINNNVQAAIESLPRIDAFLAKLQPPSNTVAVQTISSQHTFSKSLSREPGSSSPTQQPTLFSGTKAPQTITASPQVKEPAFSNPFKSGAASTEKKQTKAKEPAHEFTLPTQIEEEPKPKKDLSSKLGKTFESEQKKTLPKEDEVVVSQSSDWFESVFTTQTVSKPKETLKATVQTSEPKVQEEKEKSSAAKKEKVISSSKPSLQADDFFKDIVVPDVKTSFVPESKVKSTVKVASPVQISKEPEMAESGGWGFDAPEVKEKEKEKSSTAKKEKVTSSSKPSLQVDDFFKDIIVPDVKSTFVPEAKVKSPVKTTSPVRTSKDSDIVESGGWGFDAPEEKEKEKSITTKKEKVTSSSKPALQADDFFKDIIIPDVKSSFVPEPKIKSPVKTSSPVRTSKELEIVETGGWGFDVPEVKEKEKEKSSAAKKEKVTSSSKPSLQADDFFKDIIVPDVKSSFVPEPKSSTEPKIKSPIKTSSPVQTSKELEIAEAGGWGFDPLEEKEPSEAQTPEPSKPKPFQKEQPSKPEVAKSAAFTITKEEPKPEPKTETKASKPGLNLPPAKSVVPQFGKTTTSTEQGPKKFGSIILPKAGTSDKEKSTPGLNLAGIQTKSGTRYAPNKKAMEQNLISVESDNFFGELGLGDSSAKVDPFKGSLRESTSSLRTSQQGGDMFSQPVVKKKVVQ